MSHEYPCPACAARGTKILMRPMELADLPASLPALDFVARAHLCPSCGSYFYERVTTGDFPAHANEPAV